MIDPAYCRLMARYNAWQNDGLAAVLGGMEGDELRRDRGAFFGSILGTANHLLWGDTIWMSRFDGGAKPETGIPGSPGFTEGPDAWQEARRAMDVRIGRWADGLDAGDLAGDLTWHSGALGREVSTPRALCVVHMFNHQTHHRGQIHAMLTAAGQRPGATDLFAMPGAAE